MSRLQDSKKLPVALCHTFQSIVSEINSNSSCSVFKHLGSHCIYLSRFEFSPREQFSTLWQLRVRKLVVYTLSRDAWFKSQVMTTFTLKFIMLPSDCSLGSFIEKVCPRDVEMKRKGEH